MVMIYRGERHNQIPGAETLTSQHAGTAGYLKSIRAEIVPGTEQCVPDDAVDENGRLIRPLPRA